MQTNPTPSTAITLYHPPQPTPKVSFTPILEAILDSAETPNLEAILTPQGPTDYELDLAYALDVCYNMYDFWDGEPVTGEDLQLLVRMKSALEKERLICHICFNPRCAIPNIP